MIWFLWIAVVILVGFGLYLLRRRQLPWGTLVMVFAIIFALYAIFGDTDSDDEVVDEDAIPTVPAGSPPA